MSAGGGRDRAEHALAHLEAGHRVPDLRSTTPANCTPSTGNLGPAEPEVQSSEHGTAAAGGAVGGADRGRAHAHDELVRAGNRIGQLDQLDDLGAAVAAVACGFHGDSRE